MRAKIMALGAALFLPAAAFAGPRILSYQGTILNGGGVPVADGTYDMRFRLFGTATGGTHVWEEIDAGVQVSDGQFSTLLGDGTAFGTSEFASDYTLYLEVAVDLDADGTFEENEVYTPRQRVAGAAWAMDADRLTGLWAAQLQRRVTGTAAAGHFITGISADGTVVTAADQVGAGDITAVIAGTGLAGGGTGGDVTVSADPTHVQRRVSGSAPAGQYIAAINEDGSVLTRPDQTGPGGGGWTLTGNNGTTSGTHFLGTTDPAALDLRTSGMRALRLEPGAHGPSVIGGYEGNRIAAGVKGASIAGGGAADDGSGQAAPHRVFDDYGAIGGGLMNQAGNTDGYPATREYATVAGGAFNTASGKGSLVGGGENNTASGAHCAVLGGLDNIADGYWGTVAGGRGNHAAGSFSFAAGRSAKANHNGSFVWSDSSSGDFASTARDQFRVQARGGVDLETNGAGARIDGHTVWHDGNASHNHWGEHWTGAGTGLTLSGGETGLVSSGSTYGVFGDGDTGVYGESAASAGRGVYGTCSGGTGVVGDGRVGVYAHGTWRGVDAWGDHTGIEAGGDTYAADFTGNVTIRSGYLSVADYCRVHGNLTVDGTKSAAVTTADYGRRALYAVESPGNWFEDFGSGRLEEGEAVVALEPVFAQTINVTTATYHVFLTPLGDCALYVAAKTPKTFTVRAVGNRAVDIAFDYRIVARRRGCEHVRLAPVQAPRP